MGCKMNNKQGVTVFVLLKILMNEGVTVFMLLKILMNEFDHLIRHKKFRPEQGFEPWPLWCQCSALPAELSGHSLFRPELFNPHFKYIKISSYKMAAWLQLMQLCYFKVF